MTTGWSKCTHTLGWTFVRKIHFKRALLSIHWTFHILLLNMFTHGIDLLQKISNLTFVILFFVIVHFGWVLVLTFSNFCDLSQVLIILSCFLWNWAFYINLVNISFFIILIKLSNFGLFINRILRASNLILL